MIQSKLRYLENPGRWVCSYPWLVDPLTLPDNYAAVFATLLRTEKTLLQEPEWMKIYQAQITEHETRGVARKLTPEELAAWNGPHLYISHMCIEQPKSESTPVRVVFNSSQKFKGVSMNDGQVTLHTNLQDQHAADGIKRRRVIKAPSRSH